MPQYFQAVCRYECDGLGARLLSLIGARRDRAEQIASVIDGKLTVTAGSS